MLRALRGMGKTTPVLFLTAKDAVSDRVKGLDSGANDYLVKPFSFEELSARLRAMMRDLSELLTMFCILRIFLWIALPTG